MPLIGQGSAHSPIIVSDDEDEASVLELVDRLSSASPRPGAFGDYATYPAVHDWDRVEDRKLRESYDRYSEKDSPNEMSIGELSDISLF